VGEKTDEIKTWVAYYQACAAVMGLEHFYHLNAEYATAESVKAVVSRKLRKRKMKEVLVVGYSRCFLHVVGHGTEG
jgi:hypothetical protein